MPRLRLWAVALGTGDEVISGAVYVLDLGPGAGSTNRPLIVGLAPASAGGEEKKRVAKTLLRQLTPRAP